MRAVSLPGPSTSFLPSRIPALGCRATLRPITAAQEGHADVVKPESHVDPRSRAGVGIRSAIPRRRVTRGGEAPESPTTNTHHGDRGMIGTRGFGQLGPEAPGEQNRTGGCGRLRAALPAASSTLAETGPALLSLSCHVPIQRARAPDPALRL